jgi:small ligand-binding sensory domain FIST
MRFHSAISESSSSDQAIGQLIDEARQKVKDIDLGFVFFTADHRDNADEIAEKIWLELDPQALIGCSAEGVIGGDREVERSPGISLLVASLPGVRIHPFHVGTDDWRQLINEKEALIERLGLGSEPRALIGMGDPFTTPLVQFMAALDQVAPQAPLIGGMASSGREPGENSLIRNDETHDDGFVGVSLSGPISAQTIVSQGCKPIGRTWVITKAHDNVIDQLGGKPALAALREVVLTLGEADQALLQNGLLIGRAISEYRESFERGDFLIRGLTRVDQESGAISVADWVQVGQTIQFHVRDMATADEDLRMMLDPHRVGAAPEGGLLFSCNGRGTRLFDCCGHDIQLAHEQMPGVPLAGFFAAGEIGPVGGKNFVHGHTASFALIRGQ